MKHPGENTQKKDSCSIFWSNALESKKWIKRRALISLWKFSPDLRKHNWASRGECNNGLRCEERSEWDPAPRSPRAPAWRRETVGENCVKMSSKKSWQHLDDILQHPEKVLPTSSNILATSFNILPRCPAPGWGRLCGKVADYWGEQLLRKVFRSARFWRRPGCLRRCWWTWPGWSGSSPSCGELSQSATWRLPQRRNAQRELLAPARKEIRRVNLRVVLTAGKKFLSKR